MIRDYTKLITLQQARKYLPGNPTLQTVRNLIYGEQVKGAALLPHYRMGKRIFLDPADIDRIIVRIEPPQK